VPDPIDIAVRTIVYLALLLAFGTAVQALADRRPQPRRVSAGLLVAALVASLVGIVMLSAAMGGVPPLPVDRALLWTILTETGVGTSYIVRFVALGAAFVALALPRWRTQAVALCTAIALGSLAWAGHGAVNEGGLRIVHLGSTIVHLLAAGVWIGAIAGLLGGLRRPDAAEALHRFGNTGAIVVATLAVTGIANLVLIAGVDRIAGLPDTRYGQVLALKLAAFAAMLALAALHRWRLVPGLVAAPHGGSRAVLRASLASELLFGTAVLAIVAWLGVLSPGE